MYAQPLARLHLGEAVAPDLADRGVQANAILRRRMQLRRYVRNALAEMQDLDGYWLRPEEGAKLQQLGGIRGVFYQPVKCHAPGFGHGLGRPGLTCRGEQFLMLLVELLEVFGYRHAGLSLPGSGLLNSKRQVAEAIGEQERVIAADPAAASLNQLYAFFPREYVYWYRLGRIGPFLVQRGNQNIADRGRQVSQHFGGIAGVVVHKQPATVEVGR